MWIASSISKQVKIIMVSSALWPYLRSAIICSSSSSSNRSSSSRSISSNFLPGVITSLSHYKFGSLQVCSTGDKKSLVLKILSSLRYDKDSGELKPTISLLPFSFIYHLLNVILSDLQLLSRDREYRLDTEVYQSVSKCKWSVIVYTKSDSKNTFFKFQPTNLCFLRNNALLP